MGATAPAPLPKLAYGITDLPMKRTKAYAETAAGRLHAVKLGSRSLILADELRRYLASLPAATPETMRDTSGRPQITERGRREPKLTPDRR